jgi:hypothetical protein
MEQLSLVVFPVVLVFGLVLAILWFCLPFAVFGTKDKLDQLIAETRKTNEELGRLRQQLSGASGETDARL